MNHLFFAAFPPAILLAILTLMSWLHRQEPRPLSERTKVLSSEIEMATQAPPPMYSHPSEIMSFADTWSLYLNSRALVGEAHRGAYNSQDEELQIWHDEAEEKHRDVRRMLLLSIAERLFGLLFHTRFAHYSRAALWAYVEEFTIVSEMRTWQVAVSLDGPGIDS